MNNIGFLKYYEVTYKEFLEHFWMVLISLLSEGALYVQL